MTSIFLLVVLELILLWLNTMAKATWGERGLFGLCFHITVRHQKKSGRGTQTGQKLGGRGWCRGLWGVLTGWLLMAFVSFYPCQSKPELHKKAPGKKLKEKCVECWWHQVHQASLKFSELSASAFRVLWLKIEGLSYHARPCLAFYVGTWRESELISS